MGRCLERADTPVANPIASRLHLALEWNGRNWSVRDLSKNGTWLGSKRLAPGETTPLQPGDKLHLGSPDSPPWELIDASPPVSRLLGLEAETPSIDLESYVFLPDQAHPEAAVIYSYAKHAWQLYLMEHEGNQAFDRALRHGETVSCGGCNWEVFLAESEQATEISSSMQTRLDDIEFHFDLSLDEENTQLQLKHRRKVFDLGERSHHYLLLHLARHRANQAALGLDSKSQGWIDNDRLTKDLGVEMSHINIMIFRARKQIAHSLEEPVDSEHLVERGKGRMRFGCAQFRIYKGAQLTYQLPANRHE